MIVFDLQCTCGSQFEGWFESRNDFDRQNCDGLIICPHCGCNEIHKILSPVAYHAGAHVNKLPGNADDTEITREKALKYLKSVQDYVEKNFEDVGPGLARESLKIHYGVVEPRNIRGVVTEEEEKMLTDEGIELLKIPMLKKPDGRDIN